MPKDGAMTTWADKKAAQAAAIDDAWAAMKDIARTPVNPSQLEAKIADMDGYLLGLATMYAEHDGVPLATYFPSGGTCPPKYAF
jgi:hypothetical protein